MLISHFWYAFYFACAYKWPSFIKVATFPPMYLILVPNYEICKTKEKIKLLPYYLHDILFEKL